MSGLPDGTLMQRAAHALSVCVAEFMGRVHGTRVLLLVGSGDNGGDALYAGAALARRGARVQAVLLGDDVHEVGLAALRAAGGRVVLSPDRPVDVVLDGIVGIGGRPGLRPDAAALVATLRAVPVVAVDVPSGVGVDTGALQGPHVVADLTVTFGGLKVAHLVDPAAAACGVVEWVDIGLSLPEATVQALQAADVGGLLPQPEGSDQKYTRGVVGVATGSQRYPGAAVLSVGGAGTGLVGMVRYAGGASDAVVAAHPEVVVGEGRVQAWVVGSGGADTAGPALARALEDDVPVVVDADALFALEDHADQSAQLVLTPHAGELGRMLDVERARIEAEPLRWARAAAASYDSVVLLKGRRTIIAAPHGHQRVNTTGTPWLATAGSGDVLAGLIGALLAAGLSGFDSASVGAWLHGKAAERLVGPLVAGELPAAIRQVLMQG